MVGMQAGIVDCGDWKQGGLSSGSGQISSKKPEIGVSSTMTGRRWTSCPDEIDADRDATAEAEAAAVAGPDETPAPHRDE